MTICCSDFSREIFLPFIFTFHWLDFKIKLYSVKSITKLYVYFFRNFIIDGLSVERNHVLVRINLIGGPVERILPPRMLEKVSAVKRWGMFSWHFEANYPTQVTLNNGQMPTLRNWAFVTRKLQDESKHFQMKTVFFTARGHER